MRYKLLFCFLLQANLYPISEDFAAFSTEINSSIESRMKTSYNPKIATVKLKDLRYIVLKHWDFEHRIQFGELVVHKLVVEEIIEIFRELFDSKFPIERMQLIDKYPGGDSPSMVNNNTSALFVRNIANTEKLSNHSYGLAIDINPQQNPYLRKESNGDIYVEPIDKHGHKYLNRNRKNPGMITEDTLIYKLFTERGWEWGGECFEDENIYDFHHFDKIIPGIND